MTDSVTYNLLCMDNTIHDSADLDWLSLGAVEPTQLEWAHRVANMVLRHELTTGNAQAYVGQPGNVIWLPDGTAADVCATVTLDSIDVRGILGIAEVAAVLRCNLVPEDGGPAVAPDGQALLDDALRRAKAILRPQNQSLFEMAGGAARAAELQAYPDLHW